MADKKLPAIQWYPGDWRKDPGVQASDYETRGIWFECCMLMHESEDRGRLVLNGRPMPNPAIARLLGLTPEKWAEVRATLLAYGIISEDENGALINRRMVRDEGVRRVRAAAGSKGGKASSKQAKPQQTPSKPASKPEAGEPAQDNDNPTSNGSKAEANAKQKATPSVSVSVSVSPSGNNNNTPASSSDTEGDDLEAGKREVDQNERPERPKHPDLDRLWTDGVMDVVRRDWHQGQERVELDGDKSVGIGLEYWLFNDLLHTTNDPGMARWIVTEALHLLEWDSEPRTLYWAIRGQNFDAAFEAYLERHPPDRDPTAGMVNVKRIPQQARLA